MSDSRQRRKLRKDPPTKKATDTQKKPKEGTNAGSPSSSLSSTVLWIPVLLSIAVYLYLNPAIVASFIDEWIGFSDHYDAAPVAHHSPKTFLPADVPKRNAIVSAFKHSWHAYERDAMGDDEYHPIDKRGSNLTEAGGIGYMVVDVLDTMQIMGLQDEYIRARKWVAEKLTFDRDDRFSTFETTIRKAIDLADRMMPAFETDLGIPLPVINLAQQKGYHTDDFPGLTSIAEIGTLQLEFRYLSYLTGNEDYWKAVVKVMQVIKRARLPHGLASIFMNIDNGQYETSTIRLGSRGDSFYEYLLKQYLQTNNSEDIYREASNVPITHTLQTNPINQMYDDAMDGIHNHLVQKSMGNKMTYTSELVAENGPQGELVWRLTPKQDHLVCFLGGSLMLGATRTGALKQHVSVPPRPEELSEKGKRDWQTGVELVKTCMNTHDTATGLSPEIVYFRVPSDGMDVLPNAPPDWYIKGAAIGEFPPYDARYMLRPETVESLFLAYRLTGDQLYRDHGWRIFQAIERHCRVEGGGYATIINVDENPARLEDKMETFFLSETLKYLYLLFASSDVIPLDRYVLNTEAHPLPIFEPAKGPH
ncbi:glycoside hydrolase [Pholiota molesta]|nr:glycoside hydrolase [Pholiota molesta]